MGRERRKFIRPESLNLLDYIVMYEHGQQGEYAMGRTLNVSEGGILMETRTLIAPDLKVMITLGLNEDLVDVQGKVIRSNPLGDRYLNGIKFIDISDTNLKILQRYIKVFHKLFDHSSERKELLGEYLRSIGNKSGNGTGRNRKNQLVDQHRQEEETMGRERREFERPESLNLLDYIVYDEEGRQGEYAMGRTLNVSEGGILMETAKALPIGQQVKITLELNENLLEVTGRVVRTSPPGKLYMNGVLFTDVSEKDRKILKIYVDAFQKSFVDADSRRKILAEYKKLMSG